jgi:DNA anti-recombination protein RmuC
VARARGDAARTHVNEWKTATTHIQEDASDRMQQLETVVEREWTELRKIHEQPVAALRQQAASLTEVCIATANAAQQGFERAELRLAAFESEFHRSIGELTRELHAALAEMRSRPGHSLAQPQGAASWSFET